MVPITKQRYQIRDATFGTGAEKNESEHSARETARAPHQAGGLRARACVRGRVHAEERGREKERAHTAGSVWRRAE